MTPSGRILDEKRRLIWPIAVVLVLNIIVFVLVVYPLSKKVANGEQDAQAAAAALNAARRDHAAARATVTGKSQADAELQKFYADVLPPDMSGARRITYLRIEQLAKDSNLHLERENTEPRPLRESDLVKVTYTAALSGEYRDIRRFIHAIETAPEFLVLENVELSQVDETKGLNVNVQIATYYRTGGNGN
jgi:Tfp pilus assembly protein PilO